MLRQLWTGLAAAMFCFGNAGAKEAAYTATTMDVFINTEKAVSSQPLDVLVKITPKNGWHIYWNNPGDTGLETRISVSSDLGKTVLKKQSAPKYFNLHNTITQYAYDDAAYWLFRITPDKPGDEVSITVNAEWLACKDECVAESLTEIIPISAAVSHQASLLWEKELFAAQRTFPRLYLHGRFEQKDNHLLVNIDGLTTAPKELRFVPFKRDVAEDYLPQSFAYHNNILAVDVPLKEDVVINTSLNAVVLTENGVWQLNLQQDNSLIPVRDSANHHLLSILAAAFIGGLILNLMPCIFPVLFLKAFNLVQNACAGMQAKIESFFYFIGVITSFSGIALLLWLLRKTGENIGWGFQLQSPVFIALMFMLFLILTLMFLGIINFNASCFNRLGIISANNGKINAFLTGLFAVLIASPCSAPFMGAAIGYSITQPLHIYLPIFLTLATGYALPFTLIGLFPQQLAAILPRPGRWMETLKKLFALPMLATCIWLGWIFVHQTQTATSQANMENSLEWQAFSPEKLQALILKKQPVFIVFTAKWCLTCLLNEKIALDAPRFKQLIKDKKITLLKADWTNKDENITKALSLYGRNSVPLYVYYDGSDSQPRILPQLLTSGLLEDWLNKKIKQ